jgi:hypothetical protein
MNLPGGGKKGAHVLAWELVNGPVPDGFGLDHLCRVRHCVNPEHLEIASQAENVQRGQLAKLTVGQVREIRKAYESGEWTQVALAHQYLVDRRTISNVVLRKTWKNV